MISPGQTLENPVTGERFTFIHTASSSGGELLAFDLALRPGGAAPIPHVHPIQTERFAVTAGLMRFRVGLRRRLAGPGDVVEVAPAGSLVLRRSRMDLRLPAMERLSSFGLTTCMPTNTQDTTLVIGGHGKTGRRVAERLHARGLPVRAASRSTEPPFDWEDRATWAPAFRGATSAYVTYYPDLAVPGAPEAIAALAETALEAGTRRIVLLSGRGEVEAQRAEQELAASGADWTVVRCSWFGQNFTEGDFVHSLRAGELALPAGDVPVPFVDADDIADVAVAALTEPGHEGQVYELTGPRAITFAEAVAEISGAAGRPIRYVSITVEQFEAGMAEQGAPGDVVSLLTYLFTEVLVEDNADVADGVRRALGREPRDFAEFARRAAAAGAFADNG